MQSAHNPTSRRTGCLLSVLTVETIKKPITDQFAERIEQRVFGRAALARRMSSQRRRLRQSLDELGDGENRAVHCLAEWLKD